MPANTAHTKRPHLLVRPDYGPNIGIGHVIRCALIAEELMALGWDCTLMAAEGTAEIKSLSDRLGFHLPGLYLATDKAQALSENEFDCAVLDHYAPDSQLVEAVHRQAVTTVQIVDYAVPCVHGNMLIVPNDGSLAQELTEKAPAGAEILSGTAMSLIRRSIRLLRYQTGVGAVSTSQINHIVVTAGGTDAGNDAPRWVRLVRQAYPYARISVVLSSIARSIAALQAIVDDRLVLIIDTPSMAELLASADLVIGAGGVGLLERCCLGIPSLTIATADNQTMQAAQLAKRAATAFLQPPQSLDDQDVLAALDDLAAVDRRRKMGLAARQAVDGRGIQRIITAIANRLGPGDGRISLRLVEASDIRPIFDWQCQTGARQYARNPAAPSWPEHQAWFDRAIDDPTRWLFVILVNQHPHGLLRLDPNGPAKDGYEVSILIDQAVRGQGVGKSALQLIGRLTRGVDLWAEIDPRNFASISAFKANGFEPINARHYCRSRLVN